MIAPINNNHQNSIENFENDKQMEKIFTTLNETNVNEYTKKKGAFTYLSWAWAVKELLKIAPSATWETHEYKDKDGLSVPYMKTECGYFVKVTLWVNGVPRSQTHPVLDNRNSPIAKPNAFHINTSIQRCLAKAIGLHGLGLYIFAGEDLPVEDPLTDEEIAILLELAEYIGKTEDVKRNLDEGNINRSNYDASKSKLERLHSEMVSKEGKDDKSSK